MRSLVTLRKQFHHVESNAVERYPKGSRPSPDRPPEPGDFILTHGLDWASALIRVGQRLRFHGQDSIYAYWNHAAQLIDTDLNLIEALGGGVERGNLEKYFGTDYHLIRIDADDEDRAEVVSFARSCVGAKYGYLSIVSLFFTCLTGGKFSFGIEGEHICSGLVARGQERTRAIFNRDPEHIMPADLAKYYRVPETAIAPSDVVSATQSASGPPQLQHAVPPI
jgi:hypothetical protein